MTEYQEIRKRIRAYIIELDTSGQLTIGTVLEGDEIPFGTDERSLYIPQREACEVFNVTVDGDYEHVRTEFI